MDEYFINETTTVDDIIEKILLDLNTTLSGAGIRFPYYCIPIGKEDHLFDRNLEVQVRDTMLSFGLVRQLANTQTSRDRVSLTGKGADIYNSGGWKKFKANYDTEQKELKARQNKPSIHVNGSAIIGDNNSENRLNQGRFILDLPTNQPTIDPKTYDKIQKATQIETSKAQFIYWLFASFLAGIAIGVTIGFAIFRK